MTTSQQQTSETSLEQLLEKAATDASFRIEFYNRLLNDEILVITQETDQSKVEQKIEEGQGVSIVSFPDGGIPIFTSTDRIFDHEEIKGNVGYVQMKGRDLFGLAQDANFLLNPFSKYSKELLAEEIASLLDGSYLKEEPQVLTLEQKTEIQIGQPAIYPSEMLESLSALFAQKASLSAAYLAWIYTPASGEPAHYLLGLETENGFEDLTQEAGHIARQFLPKDGFVDFVKMESNNPVCQYMLNQTKPFYKR